MKTVRFLSVFKLGKAMSSKGKPVKKAQCPSCFSFGKAMFLRGKPVKKR